MRLKDWGKGLNLDQPPWELAPGFWSAGQNVRFRNGKAQRMGGIASATTPTVAPYALGVFQVGAAASTTRYVIEVGLAKVYAWDGSSRVEITRGLSGVFGSSSISGDGTNVTINATAHGLTTGDNVVVTGVTPSTYNTPATGSSITVVNANSFKYANTSVAAVTTGGAWYSNRTSDFTASAGDEITIFALNGILYLNTIKEGLYYWGGSTASDARGRLRRVTTGQASPQWVYGRTARPYKDYVMLQQFIQTSDATSAAVTREPYKLAWGSAASAGSIPSSFIAASTNDAGSIPKTKGAFVDGKEFQGVYYSYTENAILAAQYIGGNDVFDTSRWISESSGVLAPNCIANCDKGQVFFSQNFDVMIHQGGSPVSIANGRVMKWIRDNIDSTYYARSFLTVNRRFNEVWVCIPTTGNSTCNKALCWNWEDDTWGTRDLSSVTCAIHGMVPTSLATDDRLLLGTSDTKVGLVDSGTTDFGSSYTTTLERIGMDMDDPSYKMISRSMPLFDGSTNFTASIYHGSAATQDATPTYGSAITYTHNTSRWCNGFSGSGPYLAWKMTTTASDTPSLRSIEFDISKQGGF